MRFLYKYQDKSGEHEGCLTAPSIDVAYSNLRKSGVRPMKVWPAPGLLNRLAIGKRWAAIIVLALATVAAFTYALRERSNAVAAGMAAGMSVADAAEPLSRQQVPETVVDFEFGTERLLAAFARPGSLEGVRALEDEIDPADVEAAIGSPIRVLPGDSENAVKLKRIVASLKEEARLALRSGESFRLFVARMIERQKMEAQHRESLRRQVSEGKIGRSAANAALRLMGLRELDENEGEDNLSEFLFPPLTAK